MFANRGGTHLTGYFLIVDNGGGKTAGAQASSGEQRDFFVGSSFTGRNAEIFPHGIEQLRCTFDVARCTHADYAGVLAGGLQSKKMIEGGDAESAAQRHAQRHRDVTQRLYV